MEKKPRKRRTPIAEQFKENIVRDHHDHNMNFLELSHKYKCCIQTVKNICEKNAYGFWNNVPMLEKGTKPRLVTEKRKNLSDEERSMQIYNDAKIVIELTLQRMIEQLKSGMCNLSATQLANFMSTAAPYAIKKAEGTIKTKDETKALSSRDQFSMFKLQLDKNGKADPTQSN